MKTLLAISVFLTVAFGQNASQQQKPGPKTIHVSQLSRGQVIGKLGEPLGTRYDIEATIIGRREAYRSTLRNDFRLRVTKVKGRTLKEPVEIDFDVEMVYGLKKDNYPLYHLVNDVWRESGKEYRLTKKDRRELEQAYTGKKVKLWVYETGSYQGHVDRSSYEFAMAKDSPQKISGKTERDPRFTGDLDIPFPAGPYFHFHSRLIVSHHYPDDSKE